VYLKSDQMPHREEDAVDPKSRHKGKLDTESYLERSGVNWTSVRPVYIYGPLNYNPVEEYFFHRLKAGRPIVVPGSGNQVRGGAGQGGEEGGRWGTRLWEGQGTGAKEIGRWGRVVGV
jgi:hypothetical protein